MDEDSQIKWYVLASMSNKLQSQHEHMPTIRAMITHLQELYMIDVWFEKPIVGWHTIIFQDKSLYWFVEIKINGQLYPF